MTDKEFEWLRKELRWQAQLLYKLIQLEEKALHLDHEILSDLEPRLSSIKIQFGGIMPLGPVTLNVGQSVTASVVGFDQNGAVFTGTVPPASFSIDTPAIATIDPVTGVTVGVSAGVANATATVAGPNGPLTDTETVTVTAIVPVLSSIKISFDPTAVAAVRK